jgi:hypothetical protein
MEMIRGEDNCSLLAMANSEDLRVIDPDNLAGVGSLSFLSRRAKAVSLRIKQLLRIFFGTT